MWQPKSLKTRLILYFTAATILLSIAINIFYYISTEETLKRNMIDNAGSNISYITDNIEKQLSLAGEFSDWIFMNRTLESVSLKRYNTVDSPYDGDIRRVLDVLNDQVMSSSIGNNISSLLIVMDNGVDLRAGSDASMIDKDTVKTSQWFVKGMATNGKILWDTIVENPARFKTEDYILPIVRPVISNVYNNAIGWSFIGFKAGLISDVYKKFNPGNGDTIYVIDSKGVCISHQDSKNIGNSFVKNAYIQNILDRGKGYFDTKINNRNKLVVFNKFRMTDWIIVEELSYDVLDRQSMVLFNSTLLVIFISIMISFALTVYLSSNLTNPLRKIQKQMRNISKGNFERDTSIESTDEIGELGKGINEMAANIKALLDFKLKEEEDRRRLELKLLQSQVNPHFLYNTLNSIKWMATVQKAEGIGNMVSALGRLLKNIAKGTSDRITIKEELDLLEDYVFIQNVRYGGRIKFEKEIESQELLQCRIVKFTLQPIVENAIFHGIEPKKDAGRIKIELSRKKGNILISVKDDGVGISEDQIKSLFSNEEKDKSRGLSGMGVKNVDDRLKLSYGKGYGLDILSEVGEFTVVNIRIPIEE